MSHDSRVSPLDPIDVTPNRQHGTVVGLFAGIGGLELGLSKAGFSAEMLCEYWEPASSTLRRRFNGVPVHSDIRDLFTLPTAEVVTAGFPCTDLSQVGRTRGIEGEESGLVREVFRLIDAAPPRWVVLENVPNMLTLHGGRAISVITSWFEQRGWNWAYRTVDSQHLGVAQRRRRVIIVASRDADPRQVLFADETSAVPPAGDAAAFGFYWTEGNRGVGWALDAVPTLKGGSKLGIPSPPAVWQPSAVAGQVIVRPDIEAAERLQGFPAGWTGHVAREGHRWKLVGNAVTVNVAEWVGNRLAGPGNVVAVPRRPLDELQRWPAAAAGIRGAREAWLLSERPVAVRRQKVGRVLASHGSHPLSAKATAGFAKRLAASNLRAGGVAFHDALREHVAAVS